MQGSRLRRIAARGSRVAALGLVLSLTAALALRAAGTAGAAGVNFSVNDTSDRVDVRAGDGVCATSAGTCTLRAAIQEANALPGADAIQVPAGTYALAISPAGTNGSATGDLDITDSLAITGAGAGSTIVDGGTPPSGAPPEVRGIDRLFEVTVDGGTVTLSGLTISDGYAAEYGGGVMNSSTATVTIADSVVRGSAAGKTGGGVENHVGGTVKIRDSTLTQNYAVEGGSAINNDLNGLVELANTVVSANSAAAVGLDETLRGAGAIANNAQHDQVGTIAVADSRISDNRAGGGRSGAGIWNKGTGRVAVARTTFSKNGADGDGGAIYSGPGEVTVTGSTFSENFANAGGAISSGGSLIVLDSLFTKNAAEDWGGGIHNFNLGGVSVRSSSFGENSALSGGGLANEGSGLVTVESSTFTKNAALVSTILDGGDGGGMHSNSGGEVQIADVAFTENQARGGGGFSNGGGGIVRVMSSRFSANVAEERGGGILVEGGDVRMVDIDVVGNTSKSAEEGGGGISYAGDKSTSDGDSAAIERSRIRDNKTDGEGGGIDSRGDGPFAVVETSVTGNTAAIGGGLHHVGDAPLLVDRSTLSRNVSEHGGGLFVDGDGEATVENSTVSGNRAGQFGGGVLVSSRATVRSSTVADNNAPSGGGLNNGGGPLVGDGFVFLANTIVANNPTGGNCAGTITSLGGNLENTNTCQLTQSGDQPGTSPLLGLLADNGGPTQTHALLSSSPAQDASVCTEVAPCPPIDQRGISRPLFDGHDVGAYESEVAPGGEPAPPPSGECPKFPNSLSAEADSWIAQGSATSNSGADSSLKVKSQSGSNSRALVRFALPPLPDGCTTIASAVLRLNAASAKEGRTLAALQLAGAWTEGGVTWNNQPATTGPSTTTPSGQGALEWDVTAQTLGSYVSGNHGYLVKDAAENGPGDEQSLNSREKLNDGPPELLLVFDDSTPETTIDSAPVSPIDQVEATFAFSSDRDDSTFECSLDGAAFAACSSPHAVRDLAEGDHGFAVRSTRPIRAVDPTPASHEWKVAIPPETFVAGPESPSASTSATIVFSSDDPDATFECSLNGAPFAACTSLAEYENLGDGVQEVRVQAVDPFGNVDPTPATHAWTVAVPPETTIDAGPAEQSNSTSASFAFSGSDNGTAPSELAFECRLDGEPGPWVPCSSPVDHHGLGEGGHQFEVRAIDRAGNVDASPAAFGWTVDLTPPETAVDSGPADPSNSAAAEISFSAQEEASFACSLDGAPFVPCSNPARYEVLAEGAHRFEVHAIDRAGNVDPTPAAFGWTVDLTAPETAIDSQPADPTNSAGATIAFSADEEASFACSLDGGPFTGCSSPVSYENLAEGIHVFDVRATDRAGNSDASAARAIWTVDLTPPESSIDATPADPTNDTSAAFVFSADELSTFECRLDDGDFAACSSPVEYAGLGEGGHQFEVRALDRAGNLEPEAAAFTWAIDLTPPETTIVAQPPDPTNSPAAAFEFSADEEAAFACSLDDGPFAPCSSPARYEDLAEGVHSFDVRATDRAGNSDATAARAAWTVDLTAPETTINAAPVSPTNATAATFEFSADEPSSFECRLDAAPFAACTSPVTYEGVAEGAHAFDVRAVDRAGNADPAPARSTWIVDLTAPETTIDAGPADPTTDTSASFAFSADEEATFECSLDGASFAGCVSPTSYAGLGEGRHTFAVRAADRVGNVDPTPAARSWTVDRTPPETAIDAGPPDPTNRTSADFSFSADEPGSTLACSLDGSPFQPCGSTAAYADLEPGAHSFQVRATDPAGNTDPTPAAYGWTIDLTPPQTVIDLGPADPTNATSAAFEFSANEASSFECRLDGGAFAACSSPHSYAGLAEGAHTFDVRAVDRAGNVDSTPARATWTIDVTAPETRIDSGPVDPTNATTARFEFSADEAGSTFACSLDGGSFAACSSPAIYDTLGEGVHSFAVRATDRAGNTEEHAASHVWRIDTTPPETTIDAAPANPTNAAGASFEFSAGEAANFECRLDGGAFVPCSSPHMYAGLADGRHTFEVRATDVAGNPDPTPASHAWTVDQTAPNVTIDSGPPATTSDTSAVFTFSSGEAGASFECSLDRSAYIACSSPQRYDGLALGAHEFGVRARDAAGNTGSSAVHGWTIEPPPDSIVPETTIDAGPPGLTSSTSASFSFSADKADSTFECSLDGAAFAGCVSPREYTELAAGSHEFRVRATDGAGNVDPTPAAHSWTIDTEAPETAIDSGPPALTADTSASFSFSASEARSTFECSLDGAGFAVCTSPREYSGLAGGDHQFRVRARDGAGNVDATPAAHSWTVDAVAPETTISAAPPALTSSTSASFSFAANELGSTFECSLDSAPFAACSSPRSYSGLADGAHQFRVRATDAAGNVDSTPAAHGWTVDTAAPETAIDSAPPAETTSTSASFSFSASESGSTFECSLDGSAFASCSSPRQYSALSVGTHHFQVRATDRAGNRDGSPAGHSWTITASTVSCPGPTTLGAAADAWIDENSASSNKGSDSILKVQSKGPRDNFRALVRFLLPSVPPGCAVDTATLRLFAASMKPGRVLEASRLATAWAESTVTWNNQPPTTGAAAATTSGFGYREWEVTSHVRAMLAEGVAHGFLVRDAVEGADAEQQFHSREKGESTPQLVLRFALGG